MVFARRKHADSKYERRINVVPNLEDAIESQTGIGALSASPIDLVFCSRDWKMAPKSSAGKERDIGEEDEVLQAVILADSFNKRFKPLTVGKPRVSAGSCAFARPLLSYADWYGCVSASFLYAMLRYSIGRLRVLH